MTVPAHEVPAGRALLITGPVGVGKTTIAEAVGDLLRSRQVPHAVIDVDWLRRSWPTPPDDPFNAATTLRNLAAVCGNYLADGAQRLILAGVIETRAERDAYQAAAGVPLLVCRLHADPPTIRERLTARLGAGSPELPWFVERAATLDRVLTAAGVADTVVDAGHPVPEVAADVLATAGLDR
ncbi:AAA family ATPase [Actinoplanes sp. CA-252034]|uniref:AAA family ATPase n=1 Tax=Actinoplanes sp. CA-252034 TaxID=3239906 RepID=UPI003D971DFF